MTEEPHKEASGAAMVDDGDATARPEILLEAREVSRSILEVVVRVAGKDQVNTILREPRIVWSSENDFDVAIPIFGSAPLHVCDHPRVDIDSVDFPGIANRVAQAEREVSPTRSEVGDALAWADGQHLNHSFWLLPCVTTRS